MFSVRSYSATGSSIAAFRVPEVSFCRPGAAPPGSEVGQVAPEPPAGHAKLAPIAGT
jgi:hypothetical protein